MTPDIYEWSSNPYDRKNPRENPRGPVFRRVVQVNLSYSDTVIDILVSHDVVFA